MIIFNALQTSLSAGIGRTSYGIGKGLYEQQEVKVKLVIREEDLNIFNFAKPEDLIVVKGINNSLKRNRYEQFILPKLVKDKYPGSVIYFPDTMGPVFGKAPFIRTINDLAFKSLKKSFSVKSTIWKNLITNLSVKKCIHIITISNFSKQEVLKHYRNVDKNKVTAIHIGFNDFSNDKIDMSKVRDKIIRAIEKKYFLTVSTISPRKNIHRLVEAFQVAKDNIDLKLIIAGKDGWLYQDVYDLVDKYNLEDKVIFTGDINDEELKLLYKNCKFFIYPSLYEGFGLPPLEAISFEKMVIASNATAMPEILSNAVEYIDPNSVKDIAEKITKACNLETKKNNLIYRGKNLLKKYTWENFINEFIKVYKKII